MSNSVYKNTKESGIDNDGNHNNPLDMFPVHFRATKTNRLIRLALNIICYVYALNIIYIVVTLMNGPGINLHNLPAFHLPELEHTWNFLVRSILNRVKDSVLILMAVIMLVSILSYRDVLTEKYQDRLKEVSIKNKVTLLVEHYVESCYINITILLKYILMAIVIGILLGWSIQIFTY